MVEIDRLRGELARTRRQVAGLKRKLGKTDRTIHEGPFGSSTPSSKIPAKPNSTERDRGKMGGARKGHAGHGRRGIGANAPARRVRAPSVCPDCGGPMHSKGTRKRLVVDCEPTRRIETAYELERRKCARCGRRVDARTPKALPKCLYGNRLLAWVASEHYLYGTTLGQLENRTGIGCGSLVDALHQLARRLEPVMPRLVAEYRAAGVRRADEATWREDGLNGYAWLLASTRESVFRFRVTRSSKVPAEVLGGKPLPGVLVVDRYAGYNVAPCELQYCFAHLLRDVGDLRKEFPDDPQVAAFLDALAPELAAAMSLRTLDISDGQYLRKAGGLRDRIAAIIEAEANHPGVQNMQSIFRENAHRLYHWAGDRCGWDVGMVPKTPTTWPHRSSRSETPP
jgi:transposase